MTTKLGLRFIVIMALLGIFALPAFAQDDAEVVSEPLTETYGPMTITTVAPWDVAVGQAGVIGIATFDLVEASESGDFPIDGIVGQLRLVGIPRINLEDAEVNAVNIMGGLLLAQGADPENLPEITEFSLDNYDFARVDVSQDGDATAFVYTVVFTDTTFGIFTAASTAGLLDREDEMLAVLDTATFEFDAPIPEGATERYQQYTIGVSEAGFPRLGDPDAPVTVIEIGSFDCPHCGTFHETVLPTILERVVEGEVRFVYIPVYGTGSYANGDNAARASLCVGEENFWAYHDALYTWQTEYFNYAFLYERLLNAAVSLGVDADEFNECYASDMTSEILRAAFSATQELVPENFGTPTVLVNNVRIDVSVPTIHDAIDAALADNEEATGE